MAPRLLLLALAAVAACRATGSSPVPEARADEPAAAPAKGGVAVVELFTSEGCSSCPPADGVLARLAGRPGVYALSFHVDYWDELGWPDRFASAENTARQGTYARSLGGRGLYTPQLVVGGTDAFVGSDADHADASVARSLAAPAPVRLVLHVRSASAEAVVVDYEASSPPAGAVLLAAVVERTVTSAVRAGENSGKTLRHANVVRSFTGASLAPSGTVTLRLPGTLHRDQADVIAYAQRSSGGGGSGMPVLGATSAPLDRRE